MASLEELLVGLTAALTRQSDLTERVIAGQEAAMAKLDGAKAPTPRKKKDETPAPTPTPDATATETKQSFLPDVKDADGLKAYVSAWTGAVEGDARAERVSILKAIANHFGVEPKFGPLAEDAGRLQQTLFYIERAKHGLKIDFVAEYDFDGDPTQGGAGNEEPAAHDDSDFG